MFLPPPPPLTGPSPDWQDDDDDACKEECPDGTCNSMADHDKPECAACAACHDHDGDGKVTAWWTTDHGPSP